MLIRIHFLGVGVYFILTELSLSEVKTKHSPVCRIQILFSLARSEHVKRSPNCGFLTMKKEFIELTVAEFYHLEKNRLKLYYVSNPTISVDYMQSTDVWPKSVYRGCFMFCIFFSLPRKRFVIRRWQICGITHIIHLRALNLCERKFLFSKIFSH